MSSNPYEPKEDPTTLFLERTFIAGDFITGVGYGVQLVLYMSCALYLWETRKTQSKSLFLLGYTTLLLSVETINEIVQARTVQMIYVDNREYQGGPWKYFLDTQSLPINIVYLASYFSVTWLSDLLVFWRCWVIWSAFGKASAFVVLVFPALLILASLVMGILWVLQSSQPGLSFYSALPLAYGTSYYAISLGTNIILTVLIISRLLVYRSTVLKTMSKDHAAEYVSLATIVVESASLYSVFAICFLVTYAVNNPMNQVFLSLANSAQQIANYLIIYRVAHGRGWGTDTSVSTKVETRMSFASQAPRSMISSVGGGGGEPKPRASDVGRMSTYEQSRLAPPQAHSFPSNTTIITQEPYMSSFQSGSNLHERY